MNILVSKKQHFRCYENVIAFIAERYAVQYEVIFAKMWKFRFSIRGKNKLLSERLVADFELAEDYLREFTGLEFDVRRDKPDKFIECCRKEILAGRYVIIPAFHQNIMKKYREVDKKLNTVLLLFEINENKFRCADIHGAVGEDGYAKIIEIKEDDFRAGTNQNDHSAYIIYKKEKDVKKSVPKDLLERQVNELLKKNEDGYNAFQEMKEFGKEINRKTVMAEVCDAVSAEKYPFIEKIKEICRGRFLFNYFLKTCVSEKQFFLANYVQEMNRVGTYWSTIVSLMLKMYYKKNFIYAEKISDMIGKAAVLEEQLAIKMRSHLKSIENDKAIKVDDRLDLSLQIEQIDLKPHLNNKGISFEDDNKASYNELEYMRLDRKKDFQKLLQWNEQEYDNIVCKGQRIELRNKKGEALLVLANSEGYRSDFMAVRYSDGGEEEKLLGVSNWFGEAMFGEKVIIEGERFKNIDKYKERGGNTRDKANIFGYVVCIRKNQEMESLILPNCPDIHIFNIFLK